MKAHLKERILESETFRFWLKKAVHTTGSNYQFGLIKFLEWCDTTSDQINDEWKKIRYDYKIREQFIDKWTELIEQFYYSQLMDFAPMSRRSYVTPVISFFKAFKIPVDVDIRDRMYVKYPNRDIIKSEIKRILEHSSIREKTFYLMMLESGQRPNTLVQLRYKHIKEDFENNLVPMKIEIPVELLKDRVGNRFTFIGQNGFDSLKEYLSLRKELNNDDLIFQPLKPMKEGNTYICPETFTSIFSRTVLKLGITELRKGKPKKVRLYNLRKYFRNNIRVQDTAYRKFWMGRAFGTDEFYITRNVEEHRRMYEQAYPNLRIYDEQINPKLEDLEKKLENQAKEILRLKELLQSTEIEHVLRYMDKITEGNAEYGEGEKHGKNKRH